jgi:hypothetical protein
VNEGLYYLVRWAGWPESSNTWEPASNMTHSEQKVKEHWTKHPKLNEIRVNPPAHPYRPHRPPHVFAWARKTDAERQKSLAERWHEFLYVFAWRPMDGSPAPTILLFWQDGMRAEFSGAQLKDMRPKFFAEVVERWLKS